ncbi:5' nucleotidase, NT5C type [Ethanoligenens sp.]|uniref:5' nucleotidase, NT5C type n=1 Tax=Ethanoligenens sp. TaxID=2099655 RepID=UPI0039ED5C11
MKKKRLFVDMDGTLAVFRPVNTLETLYERGYFLNLSPHQNVVEAVKKLIQSKEAEVFVLSAFLSDSPHALTEKNIWLDKHLPEIDTAHRIFLPCGEDKKEHIPGGIRPDDFLLDDYTHNLVQWQPPARGIKLLNGINHTHGTWPHDRLRYDKQPSELATNILRIMGNRAKIRDGLPQGPEHARVSCKKCARKGER